MKSQIKNNAIVMFLYLSFIFFNNWSVLFGCNIMKWDIMDSHFPNAVFLSNSLWNGILPLWNPMYNFGVPHYANIGNPIYYPSTFLLALLGYPLWAVGVEYCFHVLLACFGMFLLTRHFLEVNHKENSILFAFLTGLLYGFSTVFLSNAEHVMIIISATWMPYIFLYVRKYLEEQKIVYLLIAGGVTGLSIQGGYPELWVALFFTLIPYFLCYEKEEKILKRILSAAYKYLIFAVFSALAGAIILIPFYKVSHLLERMGGGVAVNSYSLAYVFSTIIPGFWRYILNYEGVIDVSMISMYMGIVSVVSFPLIVFRKQRKETLFYLGIIVFSFLMMLGNNSFLHPVFYKYFPGFSTLRFPSLWRCVLSIFTLLLVTEIWSDLFIYKKGRKKFLVLNTVLLVALIIAMIVISTFDSLQKYTNDGELFGTLLTSFLFMISYFVIILFYNIMSQRKNGLKILMILFTCTILGEILWFYNKEAPITIFRADSLGYFENEELRAEVDWYYGRDKGRNRDVDYAASNRTNGEGINAIDIVYKKNLTEYGYTPLKFMNVEKYKNSYNDKVTQGNPEVYLTNNIVSEKDVVYDEWINDYGVPCDQVYIKAPIYSVVNTSDVQWHNAVLEDVCINGTYDNIGTAFLCQFETLENETWYRKIRIMLDDTNTEQICATVLFENDEEDVTFEDVAFQIMNENGSKYIEIYFPDNQTYEKVVISSADLPENYTIHYMIYERNGISSNVQIEHFYPNEIEISTFPDTPSYLVLLQANYTGWKVYVDGEEKEIETVNDVFMGIYLEPGEHKVVFRFVPIDFFVGSGITIVYYLFILFWGIKLYKGRKKSHHKTSKTFFTAEDHTFAICAYEESKYLEECILSVKKQRVKSNILIATSTPNEYIQHLAVKYQIPLCIREGKSDIAEDWNFAYRQAKTKLVTITHQDDVYCDNYLGDVLQAVNRATDPLIVFGNYGEIRGADIVTDNRLLNVKKVMLYPLRNKLLWTSRFVRRRILSFGSAICCPSVAFVKKNLPEVLFESGYKSDLDWQTWEKLSKLSGSFVYCNTILMLHRIHEESATTQIIADCNRSKEDYDMYCKFWPNWFAKLLIKFYAKSQDSNTI